MSDGTRVSRIHYVSQISTSLLIGEDMIDQEALLFRELEILKEMDEDSISTLYSEDILTVPAQYVTLR